MMKRTTITWCVLLAMSLAAYWPALRGGMVWDDRSHVTRPAMQSLQGLWLTWFDPRTTQQYYPLTHSVFWFMHRLWGDHTLGYHLSNVILHGVNATLLLVILRRLRVPGAVFAAGLFLLHPVQVESVAWITELKNTFSGLFFFLATLTYLRFDETRKRDSLHLDSDSASTDATSPNRSVMLYVAALLVFALGLLSKTAIAPWPAAMLVVIWWRQGSIEWRRDVVPLIPFIALAVGMGMLSAHWEHALWGARGEHFELSAPERILVAGRAAWFYLGTLVWPTNLMFFYPRWNIDVSQWWQWTYPIAATLAIVIAWALRRVAGRGLLAGLLLFGGMLFPSLGFINLYWQRYTFVCDHMQYLACIGIFTLIGAGVCRATDRIPRVGGKAAFAFKAAMLLAISVLTFRHASAFVNSETLWKDTIDRNKDCWMCWNNLGIEYQQAGQYQKSIDAFEAALRIKPDHAPAWTNLGITYLGMNMPDKALTAIDKAISIQPDLAEPHYNMGLAWLRKGDDDRAIASLQEAVRINPTFANAEAYLGLVYANHARLREAVAAYKSAIQHDPGQIDALNNLAWMLATTPDQSNQDGAQAVQLATQAVQLSGTRAPELLGTLAAAYARAGRFESAVSTAQIAIQSANAAGKADLAQTTADRLKLYESHQPYTEEHPATTRP